MSKKTAMIADHIALSTSLAKSVLKRRTIADLEALLAATDCGGCDNSEHCGACTCCAEAPADAVKDWTGNFNTVLTPAADLLAAGFAGAETRPVSTPTPLKRIECAWATAKQFLVILGAVEEAALAALRTWRKTLYRRDETDMEKHNPNWSFMAGYLRSAVRRQTGARKAAMGTFATNMSKVLRLEALAAGVAAHKAPESVA